MHNALIFIEHFPVFAQEDRIDFFIQNKMQDQKETCLIISGYE